MGIFKRSHFWTEAVNSSGPNKKCLRVLYLLPFVIFLILVQQLYQLHYHQKQQWHLRQTNSVSYLRSWSLLFPFLSKDTTIADSNENIRYFKKKPFTHCVWDSSRYCYYSPPENPTHLIPSKTASEWRENIYDVLYLFT